MLLRSEDSLPYALLLSSVAPYSLQLSLGDPSWPLLFLLYALPSLSLCLSIGHLSGVGPVLTFSRLAPIASGLGWALVWLAGEKLFVEGLRATQTIAYAAFSLRTRLDWALDCGHSFNTPHCVPFLEQNITHSDNHRYPDNYWPAQQFNRYVIRANEMPKDNLTVVWEPNEWYLGPSREHFYLAIPSFILLLCHCLLWTVVCSVFLKLRNSLGWFLSNFCLIIPCAIYFLLVILLSIFTFHFGPVVQDVIPNEKIEEDPMDFWGDLKGIFRTSLVAMDYSGAFTAFVFLATSVRTQGAPPIKAALAIALMTMPPCLLSVIRWGCEGHLAIVQPAYRYYATTDETFTFDVLPVCMATSPAGPLFSLLFYIAHFFYSSLAPIIVSILLIEQSISDHWPTVPPHLIVPGIIACFAAPSILLYMPMGTKIATAFRYLSQSSIIHLLVYFTIYFVYGWQSLEADMQLQHEFPSTFSGWIVSVNGPICTILLFLFVPLLLCAKFTAVFDLLMNGSDVLKHIDQGIGQLILAPQLVQRFVGTLVMLSPTIIVVVAASLALYLNYSARLPYSTLFQPTNTFLSHSTITPNTPSRPHSLAYGFFIQLLPNLNLRSALFVVWIGEIIIWFIVAALFIWNAFFMYFGIGGDPQHANMYRSFMLLVFTSLHAVALFEMRLARQKWDASERLMIYIGVATMETAMINGYMYMFACDHTWGLDVSPLLFIFFASVIRGCAILTVIAVRAHIADVARPTRTRDATEVYEADVRMGDEEDDSPIIFEMTR